MWVPHKELKNKNKKMQSIIWEKKKTDAAETEVCFFSFFSLLSFLDSRVSVRQNSSG